MAVTPSNRQRVAIVTGGGGGIGAAIAEELGRTGAFVVTMDPLVSVDGAEQLPSSEETTAGRIVDAGGAARASAASVTDRDGVRRLFADVAAEFGGLDAVVNVAGISRPTSFTSGSEQDWRDVLSVHLDGYRNVLDAALPLMAAAGHGRILGVTSGSGWRAADAGAYACAKRAVASLTWQLGRHAPPGVVVNALSPIAMTRMVTAAMGRRPPPSPTEAKSSSTGGLSLASMPTPDQLGPLAAHLVDDGFDSCHGQVVFSAGSEVAVIDEPRFLEMLGIDRPDSLALVLEAVTPGAFVPAELHQESKGGANPRFGSSFDEPPGAELSPPVVRTCAVVADESEPAGAIVAALESRGVSCHLLAGDGGGVARGFAGAADSLASVADAIGSLDAVVVAAAGGPSSPGADSGWARILAEHAGIVDQIHADAAWARAVADHSARSETPMRLVTLTDAGTAGGRSRAQASAQLARPARGATDDRVTAFAVGVETDDVRAVGPVGELVAHLMCSPETPPLSGAELAVTAGSIALRSHPRVGASIVVGGSAVPDWFDGALESMVAPR